MRIQKFRNKLAILALAAYALNPLATQAVTTLTMRSVALGNSAPSVTTTYTASFKPSISGNIGSIKFQLCDSPLEGSACNQPASASAAAATLATGAPTTTPFSSFVSGSGGQTATATTFWIVDATPQAVVAGTSYIVQLANITNPNVVNHEYYVRMYGYSDAAGTAQVEYGAMAVSTAQQIVVTGTMPESLVFCVGTAGTDCGNMTGSSVDLGTFSPISTNTGTSLMGASTNAAFGYVITVNGTVPSSGTNTIAAMGTQSLNSLGCAPTCASTPGISQFGSNVRANTVPVVGADVTGLGGAVGSGTYNLANSFRFFDGDTVAGVGGVTKANLFTNSYLVNVGGDQAAGLYTATMTYICTATF